MKLALTKTIKEVYSVVLKDLSSYGGFPFYGIAVLCAIFLELYGFAVDLIISLIAITMIVAAVRLAYFKPRPGQPRKKYTTLYERIDNSSFPSIHAARAVMISFAIYSLAPVLLTVLVLLTVAVLLSRIHFKRHDWKDLLVGIILGIVMGYYFFP